MASGGSAACDPVGGRRATEATLLQDWTLVAFHVAFTWLPVGRLLVTLPTFVFGPQRPCNSRGPLLAFYFACFFQDFDVVESAFCLRSSITVVVNYYDYYHYDDDYYYYYHLRRLLLLLLLPPLHLLPLLLLLLLLLLLPQRAPSPRHVHFSTRFAGSACIDLEERNASGRLSP